MFALWKSLNLFNRKPHLAVIVFVLRSFGCCVASLYISTQQLAVGKGEPATPDILRNRKAAKHSILLCYRTGRLLFFAEL